MHSCFLSFFPEALLGEFVITARNKTKAMTKLKRIQDFHHKARYATDWTRRGKWILQWYVCGGRERNCWSHLWRPVYPLSATPKYLVTCFSNACSQVIGIIRFGGKSNYLKCAFHFGSWAIQNSHTLEQLPSQPTFGLKISVKLLEYFPASVLTFKHWLHCSRFHQNTEDMPIVLSDKPNIVI